MKVNRISFSLKFISLLSSLYVNSWSNTFCIAKGSIYCRSEAAGAFNVGDVSLHAMFSTIGDTINTSADSSSLCQRMDTANFAKLLPIVQAAFDSSGAERMFLYPQRKSSCQKKWYSSVQRLLFGLMIRERVAKETCFVFIRWLVLIKFFTNVEDGAM